MSTDRAAAQVAAGWPQRLSEEGSPRSLGAAGTGHIRSARCPHPAPSTHASRLVDAQHAGANEDQLRALTAEALGDVYLRDGGRCAAGLLVEFTGVEQLGFDR
ncbi:hypothetical protein GCM10010501_15330 [Streptomyces libani subsp. rufus]|nr:hypothetical protein GCM10010501_15330 [Streptomyces libani subsp. rufus]